MTKYRYEILDVRVYMDNQAMQRRTVIRYFDRLNSVNKNQEVHVAIDMFNEIDDELFLMQVVTEKAADHVGSSEFYDALKDWFVKGYETTGKWTYMPYQVEPFTQYKYKFPHEKHIHMAFDADQITYDTVMGKDGIVNSVPETKLSNHVSGTDFDTPSGFAKGGTVKGAKVESYDVGSSKSDMAAINSLPGIFENAKHPVNNSVQQIRSIIIDLNDHHGWTREQVADWLETLDVDLRFKSEDDKLREQKIEQLRKAISNFTTTIEIAEENLTKLKKELEEATFNLLELEMKSNESS